MKLKIGRYHSQVAFGITYADYHGLYKAVIFDLGIWYIEFIIRDYDIL